MTFLQKILSHVRSISFREISSLFQCFGRQIVLRRTRDAGPDEISRLKRPGSAYEYIALYVRRIGIGAADENVLLWQLPFYQDIALGSDPALTENSTAPAILPGWQGQFLF